MLGAVVGFIEGKMLLFWGAAARPGPGPNDAGLNVVDVLL